MLTEIKIAFKEISYVYLTAIFAMLDGAFVSFASVLSLLFAYYNVPGEPDAYGPGVISNSFIQLLFFLQKILIL